MTLILRRDTHAPQPSEITPRAVWQDRRRLLAGAAAAAAGAASPLGALAAAAPAPGMVTAPGRLARLPDVRSTAAGAYVLDKPTPYDLVTTYNNFYEFGTDKAEPARLAGTLRPRPWSVVVDGEVHKPRTFALEDLMKLAPMEERIYRHRCVEGWSMVIPWVGWSLSTLLKAVEPTGNARYVKFTTLDDPKQMPGIRDGVLDWPYVEGLRLDEAMHPLALMAFGLYGEVLPNQNGAPVRMVVPWKYGFKSAKSIVRVSLVEKQPLCSWPESAPNEYGFYSNVNPHVDHPRWSQATERRIGESGGFGGLFAPRHPTLMFNGYEPEVGQLYAGMDLRRYF